MCQGSLCYLAADAVALMPITYHVGAFAYQEALGAYSRYQQLHVEQKDVDAIGCGTIGGRP